MYELFTDLIHVLLYYACYHFRACLYHNHITVLVVLDTVLFLLPF